MERCAICESYGIRPAGADTDQNTLHDHTPTARVVERLVKLMPAATRPDQRIRTLGQNDGLIEIRVNPRLYMAVVINSTGVGYHTIVDYYQSPLGRRYENDTGRGFCMFDTPDVDDIAPGIMDRMPPLG